MKPSTLAIRSLGWSPKIIPSCPPESQMCLFQGLCCPKLDGTVVLT